MFGSNLPSVWLATFAFSHNAPGVAGSARKPLFLRGDDRGRAASVGQNGSRASTLSRLLAGCNAEATPALNCPAIGMLMWKGQLAVVWYCSKRHKLRVDGSSRAKWCGRTAYVPARTSTVKLFTGHLHIEGIVGSLVAIIYLWQANPMSGCSGEDSREERFGRCDCQEDHRNARFPARMHAQSAGGHRDRCGIEPSGMTMSQ